MMTIIKSLSIQIKYEFFNIYSIQVCCNVKQEGIGNNSIKVKRD